MSKRQDSQNFNGKRRISANYDLNLKTLFQTLIRTLIIIVVLDLSSSLCFWALENDSCFEIILSEIEIKAGSSCNKN